MKKLFAVLFFAFVFSAQLYAQTDIIEQQKLEDAAQTAGEDADLTELETQRNYYRQHPLDINNADYQELMESGLMNELQAEALLYHIRKNGKLLRAEELQTINGFDPLTIQTLLQYIKVKPEPDLMRRGFSDIFKNGKHQLTIRSQQVLETQKGFTSPDEPGDTRYLGDPYKLYARYRFTFGSQLSVGVTGEKDAGEDFFNGTQKNGFDFYSGHIFLKEGKLKALALGDYQLKYGQGLVIWSGLATGKTSDVINIKRNSAGIRPYTSVNEFSYLRGGAASYSFGKITLDAFYSHRNIDASLGGVVDSTNDDILITSFAEDGYHRTESEMKKKGAVKNDLVGGHLNYLNENLEVGVTGFYSTYGSSLEKNKDAYSQFDVNGKEFSNVGVNYSYNFRNLLFFGESARSGNNAFATLNGIMMSLDPRASFSLMYRNYSRDYEIIYNNAFRESDNANERGLYMGLSLNPVKGITWSSYIDFFQFPWLRYQVDGPSYGNEFLTQLTWTPNRKSVLYIRFKQQEKEENFKGDSRIDELVVARQQNIRLNASYKISSSFSMQSRFELNLRKVEGSPINNGTVLFQDLQFNKLGSPITAALRYAIFDTDDYDTRIYAYESDIPGVFSIPSYYYKGRRMYAMIRYKITRDIDFWIRWGTTVYDNKDVVGSGLDEISSNHKSDVKMQLRVDF
ncbi:MAG: helix-hairpin-helix domain-containing protein [Bacteroidota bacterium]